MVPERHHVCLCVISVFMMVASLVPLQIDGAESPFGENGTALKKLIGHNMEFTNSMLLAMRDIIHKRQASGCTLDLYESQKFLMKTAQHFAREMAVTVRNLHKEALRFQIPELATCTNQCQTNEWTCKNSNCIQLARRCDGRDDCGDGSDEGPSCMTGCGIHYFRCPSDPRCLPSSARCDGVSHCTYGLDELCQSSCGHGQFLCRKDQRCIDFHWTCDGDADCSDGEDENLCAGSEGMTTSVSQTTLQHCRQEKFRCTVDNVCIPLHMVCDYIVNCKDGSDEKNCPGTTTPTSPTTKFECSGFRCRSGWCIPLEYVCDGYRDCFEADDERNCDSRTTQTTRSMTEETTTPGVRLGITSTALIPVTFDIPNSSSTSTVATTSTTATTVTTPTSTTSTPTTGLTVTPDVPVTTVSCRAGFIPCTADRCIHERLACSTVAGVKCTIISESVQTSCEKCIASGVNRANCFEKSGILQRCRNWGWSSRKCLMLVNHLKFPHHHRG